MLLLIFTLFQITQARIESLKSQAEEYSIKFYSNVLPFDHHLFQSDIEQKPLNYCSFFNNRAPSPQINLKNCTWYKENSCCLQSEIESTFSKVFILFLFVRPIHCLNKSINLFKVKPLIGSSELCQKYLNNLMCYICAPNQFKFYGKERLTVCLEYCDQMYNACGDAILKGSRINNIYTSGEDFCKNRRYNVDRRNKDNCFYYEIDHKINGDNRIAFENINLFLLTIMMFCFNL
jgi:hypothetical protein